MPTVAESNAAVPATPADKLRSVIVSSSTSSLTLTPDRESELDSKIRELLKDDVDAINAAAAQPENLSTIRRLEHTSMENIIKYARYAGAAYLITGTEWKGSPNSDAPDTAGTVVDVHWDTDGDNRSHGFVAHKDDTQEIIVSFRGTRTLDDWVTDAEFGLHHWPTSVKDSLVHAGFYLAYMSASSLVKEAIAGLVEKYPDYSIVFTGHSLGGAEASVAAADMILTTPEWTNKISVFTYGQPRVGNPAFSDWLSTQDIHIYRVVYQEDIVPHVPMLSLGYRHHTQEVFYLESGKDIEYGGDDPENPKEANSVGLFELSVRDHSRYPGLHG
ncbi:alpha/beta-hydrolase [Martensiomyces pterosporus]|nr:alpha/beta-hydrolase [Martensiomyces pterosporus]